MNGLQEKFQVILPPQPDEDDGTKWVTAESAHTTSREIPRNEMPGLDLPNENKMLRQIAGCTDFSYDTNPKAMAEGYTRRAMKGSDDQYTGEHVDHFYGEVVDENGKAGFVERNNYLDRL